MSWWTSSARRPDSFCPETRRGSGDRREGLRDDADADSTLAKLKAVTDASNFETAEELNVFIVRSATAFGWWCGRRPAGKDVIVAATASGR